MLELLWGTYSGSNEQGGPIQEAQAAITESQVCLSISWLEAVYRIRGVTVLARYLREASNLADCRHHAIDGFSGELEPDQIQRTRAPCEQVGAEPNEMRGGAQAFNLPNVRNGSEADLPRYTRLNPL